MGTLWIRMLSLRACALGVAVVVVGWGAAAPARADVTPGETIDREAIARVRPLIPSELHPYTLDRIDAPRLEIIASGDYRPHPRYVEATKRHACEATLDEHGHIRNYTAGEPFPYSEWAKEATGHACDLTPEDPNFALKLAWNVNFRWMAGGIHMPLWAQSYWRAEGDNTWKIAQGVYRRTIFSHRADLLPETTELVPDTDLEWAEYSEALSPFDQRGTIFLTYRYKDSRAKPDDAWMYQPTMRRVRRISTSQKSDSVQGTDFTLEDFFLFSGYVWNQDWRFRGETTVLATLDTERRCFPLNVPGWSVESDHLGEDEHFHSCRFAPYKALPFVGERWQKRTAIALEQVPRREGHPYSRRLLWYDKETYAPLYSVAYDRNGEPLRVFWYVSDWSETTGRPETQGDRMLLIAAAIVVNVQKEVSNLMLTFGTQGDDLTGSQAQDYFDFTRLKGRAR